MKVTGIFRGDAPKRKIQVSVNPANMINGSEKQAEQMATGQVPIGLAPFVLNYQQPLHPPSPTRLAVTPAGLAGRQEGRP